METSRVQGVPLAEYAEPPLIVRKETTSVSRPPAGSAVRSDREARQAAAQWTRASIVLASVLGVALLAYFLAPSHQAHDTSVTEKVKDAARQAGYTGQAYQVSCLVQQFGDTRCLKARSNVESN